MAFVNKTNAANDGSATTLAAAAQSHTSGNLLIAFIVGGSSTNFVNQVTDTALNTWEQCSGARATSAGVGHCDFWFAKNITGNAANIITATYAAANTFRRIIVLQHSDMHLTAPFDDAAIGSGGPGTTSTTGTFTTTEPNEVIIVGSSGDADTSWKETYGSNFNARDTILTFDAGCIDKTVGDIQSGVTASMLSTASVTWLISVATFKFAPNNLAWNLG